MSGRMSDLLNLGFAPNAGVSTGGAGLRDELLRRAAREAELRREQEIMLERMRQNSPEALARAEEIRQNVFRNAEANWLGSQVLPANASMRAGPAGLALERAPSGVGVGMVAPRDAMEGSVMAARPSGVETPPAPTAAAPVDPLDRPLRGPLGMLGDLYGEAAQRAEARRAAAGPLEPPAVTPAVEGGLVNQFRGIRERREQIRRGMPTTAESETPNIDAARRGAPSPSAITNEAPGSALTRWMRGF
jgi:hypothetical protein